MALLFFVGTIGCKKNTAVPLPIRVTRVAISVTELEERFSTTELRAAAQRGLIRANVAVVEDAQEAGVGDFQLRMQVRLEENAEDHMLRAMCAGMLSARHAEVEGQRGPELSKLEHVGLTEKALKEPIDSAAVLSLLQKLIEDTAHTLGTELHLLAMDTRALLALVGKDDGDFVLRKTAIQILGQRKERLAVPVLIGLIKERAGKIPREEGAARQAWAQHSVLRDTAIGALVEIGDESAVRPLLDSVPFGAHSEMGKLLEAVATLGGNDARRYLQFVRSSHPEPAIRSQAEEALTRLEKRRKLPDAGAPSGG